MPDAEPASSLVCRFVADVLKRTMDIADDAAYQRAVQAFVDELRPWMPPVIGGARPHAPLFSRMEIEDATSNSRSPLNLGHHRDFSFGLS